MLFTFRSRKGSPYNIFGTILLVFFMVGGFFLAQDTANNPDESQFFYFLSIIAGGAGMFCMPGLYAYEMFWWWRYERATAHEKQKMIEKLARKKAEKDSSKNYIDYMNEFYEKYGNPIQEAAQEAKRNEEQRIWEEAYRRATPEQKARMTKERDKQEAYNRLSPEEKQRRKEQEEFERKVQSTLNRY